MVPLSLNCYRGRQDGMCEILGPVLVHDTHSSSYQSDDVFFSVIFNIYFHVFLWLHWILVAVRGIFIFTAVCKIFSYSRQTISCIM